MIYLLQFNDTIRPSLYAGYFTIVESKMDKEIVDRAIERFNIEHNMNLKMGGVETIHGKNIVKFLNTSIICVIQRCEDEAKVKGSNLGYINSVSKYKIFDLKYKVADDSYEYFLERVDYDDNFCKCLFKLVGTVTRDIKYVVRYGEPFNDGFNTSINNKRIQVRFSDGNIRFRDIAII